MTKNILVIDSGTAIKDLADFYKGLSEKEVKLFYWTKDKDKTKIFFGPSFADSLFKTLLFVLLRPFFYLYWRWKFSFLYKKEKIDAIICHQNQERIIFSSLAKKMGCQVFWLFEPNEDLASLPKFIKKSLLKKSALVKILCFSEFEQEKLKRFSLKNLQRIIYGININNNWQQDNLFLKLAQAKEALSPRKYFTIGCVTELKMENHLDYLFKNIKQCLEIIPNLQLIIIGDGPEKKKLLWAVNQMGIGNLIWFVGKQDNLQKWFNNFDLLVEIEEKISYKNFNIALQAMSAGVPVMTSFGVGLESVIVHNKSGFLINLKKSEVFTQNIINYEQDRDLQKKLKQTSKEQFENINNVNNMINNFIDLL